MQGVSMQKLELNEGFKALVNDIFKEKDKSEKLIKAFEEVINDRATTSYFSIGELKEKATNDIRGELSTKEFVRAEIVETKAKIAETKAGIEKRLDRQDYMLYGLFLLIILFDSPLVEIIQGFINKGN